MNRSTACAGLVAFAVPLGGCGLEAFVNRSFSDDHDPIVSVVAGEIANNATQVTLVQADGATLEPDDFTVGGGRYELVFGIDGELTNALIEANEGASQLKTWLLRIGPNESIDGVNLDATSTAKVLLMQGAMSAQDKDRQTVDVAVASNALSEIDEQLESETSTTSMFVSMVDEILTELADPADTESTPLVAPVLTSSTVVESALDPTWWAENSANASFTQEQFDDATLAAASRVNVIGCISDTRIRVVLEVNVQSPRFDSSCQQLTAFEARQRQHVQEEPGDSMRFVGGVLEESPIQDQELNRALGDMTPTNSLPMFDDGTNGDEVEGDNIYTITFEMPIGVYIQYKYLWSPPSAGWNGNEEWPGNAHWLEIVDVNGDNYVRRREAFGDEAGNKNQNNFCCGAQFEAFGALTFEPPGNDPDEDGIVNTRERPLGLSTTPDCEFEEFVTPTGIGPVTVECPTEP